MCVANISGVLGDMFRFVYARFCCRLCLKKKQKPLPNQYDHDLATARPTDVAPVWGMESDMNGKPLSNIKSASNDSRVLDDPEQPIEDEENKVSVPLTVTMLIILAYLLLGGVIFSYSEGWGIVGSIYFCFITLATIGNFKNYKSETF